jgi:lactate dehydrogenase-like 2-hydroxyacid dehydrogenase
MCPGEQEQLFPAAADTVKGLSMKIFVYNMREFDELPYFEEFSKKYGMEFGYTTEFPGPDNYKLAEGYDALSIITTPTPAEMIDAMKENGVKVISTRTIGYDHIDVAHAHEVGIGVANVTYGPATVSEFAIMLMLMACRKMKVTMKKAARQDFTLEDKLGKELQNCTVGIIGTGRIGAMTARQLSGFGCRILAYSRHEKDEVKEFAEYTDLDTLLKESDIISLHAHANDETFHMINEEAFAKMKDGVIIVNTARGQLINTKDLIAALDSGKVGFAALDVIENEIGMYYKDLSGVTIDNPDMYHLQTYDNVIITPHHAFYTKEAVAGMVENSIIGIKAYLDGEDHEFIIK